MLDTINHNIENLNDIIDVVATTTRAINNNGYRRKLPYTFGFTSGTNTADWQAGIVVSDTQIMLEIGEKLKNAGIGVYLTLYYTKKT